MVVSQLPMPCGSTRKAGVGFPRKMKLRGRETKNQKNRKNRENLTTQTNKNAKTERKRAIKKKEKTLTKAKTYSHGLKESFKNPNSVNFQGTAESEIWLDNDTQWIERSRRFLNSHQDANAPCIEALARIIEAQLRWVYSVEDVWVMEEEMEQREEEERRRRQMYDDDDQKLKTKRHYYDSDDSSSDDFFDDSSDNFFGYSSDDFFDDDSDSWW